MAIIQKMSIPNLVFRSMKRTREMFISDEGSLPEWNPQDYEVVKKLKARDNYGPIVNSSKRQNTVVSSEPEEKPSNHLNLQIKLEATKSEVSLKHPKSRPSMPKPQWHAPWKLSRVISGNNGWVRCIGVDPTNEWFCTGSADNIIKIWDLASGRLKLSLTGHVSTVRAVQVSSRHPYLFSAGEDGQIKCWDMEYNKVIRHYHGHLNAVYSLSLHPNIDVLATGGRDSTARVWDMRTRAQIHVLTGHTDTVNSVVCQAADPQIITASADKTVRLWDLAAGRSRATLTNHKRSVRALALHPTLYTFVSASPDNIKQWKCPEGKFIQNLSGHNAIINSMAVNADNVLVSGADDGSLHFWDYKTGYNFQQLRSPVQPGSMENEAGIFAVAFDHSGTRLITAEADKTIKIYKEDCEASEETHPVHWKPDILKRRRF